MMFLHSTGWMFQNGELRTRTSAMSTFSHSVGLDERRAQHRAFTKHAILHRAPRPRPSGTASCAPDAGPACPASSRRAPCRPRGLSRPTSAASLPCPSSVPLPVIADVLFLVRVDQRRVVHQLHAFPAREHHGIAGGVGVELQRRAFGHVQLDIALEMDGAGEEGARRNQHAPAAGLGALCNGLGDGRCIQRGAIGTRTELRDVEYAIGKGRRLHLLRDVGGACPCLIGRNVGERATRGGDGQCGACAGHEFATVEPEMHRIPQEPSSAAVTVPAAPAAGNFRSAGKGCGWSRPRRAACTSLRSARAHACATRRHRRAPRAPGPRSFRPRAHP